MHINCWANHTVAQIERKSRVSLGWDQWFPGTFGFENHEFWNPWDNPFGNIDLEPMDLLDWTNVEPINAKS